MDKKYTKRPFSLNFFLTVLLISLVSIVPAAAQDGPSGQLTVFMWGGPPDIDTYEAAIARYMDDILA